MCVLRDATRFAIDCRCVQPLICALLLANGDSHETPQCNIYARMKTAARGLSGGYDVWSSRMRVTDSLSRRALSVSVVTKNRLIASFSPGKSSSELDGGRGGGGEGVGVGGDEGEGAGCNDGRAVVSTPVATALPSMLATKVLPADLSGIALAAALSAPPSLGC